MTASKKAHCKIKLRVNELQKEAVAGNCFERTKSSSKFGKFTENVKNKQTKNDE